MFALPGYQANAGVPAHVETGLPGRGVPDVAGDADPDTGYSIRVDGSEQAGVGGTSAVAPLWAALAARMNQLLGQPVGFLQPQLYTAAGNLRLPGHHERPATARTALRWGGMPALASARRMLPR